MNDDGTNLVGSGGGERRSRWGSPSSSSRVEDVSSQQRRDEVVVVGGGRRGYDTMNSNDASSRRVSGSGVGGGDARSSHYEQQQPRHHRDSRDSEGRSYHNHHQHDHHRLHDDHQGGDRRWRGDEDWNYSEERNSCEQREGDASWRCLECGLSIDQRRCERCPRCRTWIDTSSSSSTYRRPSGEYGDGRGGGFGEEGHSSSAYDDAAADRQQRRHHRRSVGGYDDYEHDGNNYYSRPSDRRSRRSRDGDDGSDHYYGPRDYDDNRDRDDGLRKKRRDNSYNNEEDNEISKKRKREWPPCFESSGASFIFDARSTMFYEPASDFFYDPKTKLYYSNARQQYYRYEVDKEPKFQPIGGDGGNIAAGAVVQPSAITTPVVTEVPYVSAESSRQVEVIAALTKPEKVEPKQKIAISLKTPLPAKDSSITTLNYVAAMEKIKLNEKNFQKKGPISSSVGGDQLAASVGTLPQAHKKHAEDISKWSERVKEIREEGNITETQQPQPPNPPPSSNEIKTTASGQPMCVLCRRKFANVEKLRQHEKLSTLHKENLAKQAAATSSVTTATDASLVKKEGEEETTYRDRSKERRLLYGSHVAPQSSHAEALLAHSFGPSSNSTSSEAKQTQVIRPEDTLNDTNVGNKLLQKLGWKSGETLGRSSNATEGSGTKNEDVVSNNLRSDWERIESLAQGGGQRR